MEVLIVVNREDDFPADLKGASVITAKKYLTDPELIKLKDISVINLCRSYRYQTSGYYVSLLAEARGHNVIPSITTIQDTKTSSIIRLKSLEIQEIIQKNLGTIEEEEIIIPIYFGKTADSKSEALGLELFNQFPAPLLEATFSNHKDWVLTHLSLLSLKELKDGEKESAIRCVDHFLSQKSFLIAAPRKYSYDIAILINPDDPEPPSGEPAVRKFIKAAATLGMRAWTITKDDYNQIGEYDGLFIRETTNVNHHTYRFARRATVERMAVMDDPESILRCSNKVYQAELLNLHEIPTPKTIVINRDSLEDIQNQFSFPLILKSPDSAFSKGVVKVKTAEELERETERMFSKSELLIIQEFLPSSFDWRIGILDQKPLFACKYFMAKEHWQIINQTKDDDNKWGGTETVDVNEVPEGVLQTALNATNLIGKGLYGVDIKEIENKSYVIEINDNPNIDVGYEDKIIKDELYLRVMGVYLKRIKELKGQGN